MDASQRARGWPGDDGPGAGVEVAFVAGAVPPVLVGLEVDDAAEVGALLAEGDDVAIAGSQQDGQQLAS